MAALRVLCWALIFIPFKFQQFFAFFLFSRLLSAYLKISTLLPDFAKCNQVCLFFSTDQIRSSTRNSHPASSHEIFRQFSKSFAHFFRFLVFFQNIYMRILFNEFQRSLCAILFEVLCWL